MGTSQQKQLAIIVWVVSLGFLGISLPYPIFAPMLINNVGHILGYMPPHHTRVIALGFLLCVYPFGQFFGASILGALSDTLGRKKTLTLSLIGTLLGYVLSGLAIYYGYYILLIIARLFTGFCEGNVSIAQAAASDMSASLPKSISFSRINAAIAVAYILGPLLGGGLVWMAPAHISGYALPFITAAVLSALSVGVVFYFFNETLIHKADTQSHHFIRQLRKETKESAKTIVDVLRDISRRHSIIIFLLFYVGIDLFYEFYPLLFIGKWAFLPIKIALFSAVYTLPYYVSQIFIVPAIGKKYTSINLLKYTGLLVGLLLLVFILPNSSKTLYLTLPLLGIGISFCSTNTAILVSDSSDEKNQGKTMGVAQSLRMLNIAIITMLGGVLGAYNVLLPMAVAGFVLLLTSSFMFINRRVSYGNIMD